MRNQILCAAILTLLSVNHPAYGHEAMQFACAAPERPIDDANDLLWQRFLQEIDAYRTCVQRAMDQHQVAATQHQAAARSAVTSWNEFVRTSLNAPEDFPWPPEE